MKRLFALLLVLCLMVGVLCACNPDTPVDGDDASYSDDEGNANGDGTVDDGNADADDDNDDQAQGNSTTKGNKKTTTKKTTTKKTTTQKTSKHVIANAANDLANTTEGRKLVNNCYTVGYPIAKKTVTLQAWIKDYTGGKNYNQMAINAELKSKMNVSFKWTPVDAGSVVEKQTLAYTSGNMPDVFMGFAPSSLSDQWTYIKQGRVRALDDLIENYAPNINRLFAEKPEARYSVTMEDGNIYSVPMLSDSRNDFVFHGLYINKNWLAKVGKKLPTTTTQFMQILQAFKNNDPNGNGRADEIPLCLPKDSVAGSLPACLYGPFGLAVYGGFAGFSITDAGKVQANFITDNYKTALSYYNYLWKGGLIDPNWFNNTKQDMKSKLQNRTCIVGALVSENLVADVGYERSKDYILVPAFKDASVSRPTWSITDVEYIWAEYYLITSKCKYPEVAIRVADYFYSLEGTCHAMLGSEGKNWKIENGAVKITDDYFKSTYNDANFTPGYGLPHYESASYVKITNATQSKYSSEAWKYHDQLRLEMNETYSKVKPKNVFPGLVQFSTDKSSVKYNYDEMYQYVQRECTNFLSGKDSFELWDNYIGVCKDSFYIDVQVREMQLAYDRYAKAFK